MAVAASKQSIEDELRDRGEDFDEDLLVFDDEFFQYVDPLTDFHGWLRKFAKGLETRRLRKMAESKRRQQARIDNKLLGKAKECDDEELELAKLLDNKKKKRQAGVIFNFSFLYLCLIYDHV